MVLLAVGCHRLLLVAAMNKSKSALVVVENLVQNWRGHVIDQMGLSHPITLDDAYSVDREIIKILEKSKAWFADEIGINHKDVLRWQSDRRWLGGHPAGIALLHKK